MWIFLAQWGPRSGAPHHPSLVATMSPLTRSAVTMLLATSAAIWQAPSSPRAHVPAETRITLAVEDAAGLWSRADGTGFANDVVRAAFAAAGVSVWLDVVPYARCKRMVVEGAIAGCFSMSPDEAADTSITFPSTPTFICHSVLYARRGGRLVATRAADLPRGTVVGVVLGYEYPDALHALARDGRIVLEPAGSEEINLRKLVHERLDAIVLNLDGIKTADWIAARAGVSSDVRPLIDLGTMPSYVGFSRTHRDGPRALAAFETGMRRIAQSGELARIERAWKRRALAEAR
jgi:polar amino acid transport system substrate-binding protein